MANTGFIYKTPAHQQDFSDPNQQTQMDAQWDLNLKGFTAQGLNGTPWNVQNAAQITNYIDPTQTVIPSSAINKQITWSPLPGRLGYYYPSLSLDQIFQLADTGDFTRLQLGEITNNPCNPLNQETKPYGPYGPRGWQDEYCEWAVTRDQNGHIVRIDFTCENPEYWNTLWLIDPNVVLSLYQSILDKPQITLDDLCLYDANGNKVQDPNGNYVYNPLNIWNSGTISDDTKGGAIHLTSTPNTLQTEIGLATQATMMRVTGNSDLNALICCAQYGQPHRNSDPNIGGTVNRVVSSGFDAMLANPPGLYMQMPDFSQFTTPDGSNPADWYTIKRGSQTLIGDNGQPLPGNFILHAVVAPPAGSAYTVSDLKINGENVNWGSQISNTFLMQIVATAYAAPVPAKLPCVVATSQANTFAQPLQLFQQDIFDAMLNTNVPNPVDVQMNLLSNSTLIAPFVPRGAKNLPMVLTCDLGPAFDPNNPPFVSFEQSGINGAINVSACKTVTYAVPGNSYPGTYTALYLNVSVPLGAQPGLCGIYVTNQGQRQNAMMPALMNIV